MKLKTAFRMWTLSGSLSALTFCLELVNNYLSINSWYRTVFFVVVGVIMIISFLKSLKSYKHIMTMRLIGQAIRKKANNTENKYELKVFKSMEALSKALLLDKDTYDEEHTWSMQRWSEFYKKNKYVAFGLFNNEDYEQNNCLGGISCFPIKKEVFMSLKKREIDEMDITAEDLLSDDEMRTAGYWLIPGLVIFHSKAGTVKSSIILSSFLNWIVDKTRFPISFIAFGYSTQGKGILRKFGFSKFKQSKDEDMYVYTNTVSSIEEMFLKVPDVFKR